MNIFYNQYPELTLLKSNKDWHDINKITSEKSLFYKKEFSKFLLNYMENHTKKLFIFEGSEVFTKIDSILLYKRPLIVQGTSSLKFCIRR